MPTGPTSSWFHPAELNNLPKGDYRFLRETPPEVVEKRNTVVREHNKLVAKQGSFQDLYGACCALQFDLDGKRRELALVRSEWADLVQKIAWAAGNASAKKAEEPKTWLEVSLEREDAMLLLIATDPNPSVRERLQRDLDRLRQKIGYAKAGGSILAPNRPPLDLSTLEHELSKLRSKEAELHSELQRSTDHRVRHRIRQQLDYHEENGELVQGLRQLIAAKKQEVANARHEKRRDEDRDPNVKRRRHLELRKAELVVAIDGLEHQLADAEQALGRWHAAQDEKAKREVFDAERKQHEDEDFVEWKRSGDLVTDDHAA